MCIIKLLSSQETDEKKFIIIVVIKLSQVLVSI